jgi:ADP-ribose pyrophosphatase
MTDRNKLKSFPQIAVGAVVFNDAGEVLLVKRLNEPSKNLWAIPGGRLQAGETLKEAAKREIFEETSVKIEPSNIVYTFELLEKNEQGDIKFHYIIIDYEAEFISGTPRAADDAKESAWVSRERFKTINVNRSTRKLLQEKYDFAG